jgi:hypothetical protein
MLVNSMKIALRSLALASLVLHLLGGTSSAHFGGEAFILVPLDHVLPGQTFEIIVADLTPGSTIQLTAVQNGVSVPVGTAQSDAEGHFTTSATLPADYPHGYFELVATAGDGTQASTWVLAGPRTSETGNAPAPTTSGGTIDPSLVVLLVLVGGSVAAAGYVALRRARARVVTPPIAARRSVAPKRSRARPRQG